METKQLRLFVAVARAGSFSKAGAICNVAQPVLSRYMREIEEELGVPLFLRTGRGVVLTPPGERFLAQAEHILADLDQAVQEMKGLAADPIGEAILGVPPTVGSILIVPLVSRFIARYPRGSLKVVEVFSGAVAEWLSTGRLDVAVLYNPPKSSTLMVDHLLDDELVMVCPPNPLGQSGLLGPIPTAQLDRVPLVLPGRPHGLRTLVEDHLAKVDARPRIVVEVDSLLALTALVEAGLGSSILPFAAVKALVVAGRLTYRRIVEPTLGRRLVIATSTSRPTTSMARRLVSLVKSEIDALVANGDWSSPGSDEIHSPRSRAAAEVP